MTGSIVVVAVNLCPCPVPDSVRSSQSVRPRDVDGSLVVVEAVVLNVETSNVVIDVVEEVVSFVVVVVIVVVVVVVVEVVPVVVDIVVVVCTIIGSG